MEKKGSGFEMRPFVIFEKTMAKSLLHDLKNAFVLGPSCKQLSYYFEQPICTVGFEEILFSILTFRLLLFFFFALKLYQNL